MNVTVTFRHTEPMESLKAYAEEKIKKIDKFLDTYAEAHVVLSVEKFRHQADVTLNIKGTVIKAVEVTEDMYSAIDQVMDKVEKQVKRYLSRSRDRRHDHSGSSPNREGVEVEEGASDALMNEVVIEEETVDLKPMDPEEAAMQLSLSNKGFIVFRNARSDRLNVIYKKSNGNYGLIKPS